MTNIRNCISDSSAAPIRSQHLPVRVASVGLRRLTTNDLDAFQAYRTDPQLARYQGWSITSDDEALAFLAKMEQANLWIPGEWIQLGIVLSQSPTEHSDDATLIGDMGICWHGEDQITELGITVRADQHRQGVASLAMRLSIHWVLQNVATLAFHGICDTRNAACIALLESIGMRLQKTIHSANPDEPLSEHVYAINKPQFAKFRVLPK